MATYDDIVPAPSKQKPVPVEIAPLPYKHSIVDSSKQPLETLATWIGGSNWYVDYYSQVLGRNEEPKPFDPNQHIAYQQYRKINRLIVKLQGALNTTDDQGTGRMQQSGNMVINPYPGLVPNVGDTFIADIGEGGAGIFNITAVNKFSLNAQSAFDCSFELSRFATEDIVRKIDAKVTEDLYYYRDYLIVGENPILIKNDWDSLHQLKQKIKEITQAWLATNFSYSCSTVTLPKQPEHTYDQYVVRAMLNLVSSIEHNNYKQIVQYNSDDHRWTKYTDVYTAIYKREKWLLENCFKEYVVMATAALKVNSLQNSIKYSNVNYVVAPLERNKDSDNYSWIDTVMPEAFTQLQLTPNASGNVVNPNQSPCYADINLPCNNCSDNDINLNDGGDNIVGVDYNALGDPGMDIPRISNDSYVLSKAFYSNNRQACTNFERLVLDILDDKRLNYSSVLPFCNSYHHWGRLEQFYLGPILICMIQSALRGLG